MAEAIWNDRYILSNMTSEKLYAKSPLTMEVSGTSAYIGLEPSATYNETVLYESTAQTSALSFSEPLTAFERVLVCAGQVSVGSWGYTYLNLGDTNKYYAGFVRFIGGNNPVQIGGCVLKVNSQHTSGNLTPCGRRWLPTTTNAGGGDTNQFYFTKVIGINRKQ